MASSIFYRDTSFFVSNMRLGTLVTFAVECGGRRASTETEEAMVRKLRQKYDEEYFPGADFDLEEYFPDLAEKKFWSAVFDDVGQAIFRRELGNQKIDTWQAWAIADSLQICRMLLQAVQEVELGWHW